MAYQLGETFDLGRAYATAQQIKESKQIQELRALQIEQLKKPKVLSFDEMFDNERNLYSAASAVAEDPSDANVNRHWDILEKRGIVSPDARTEFLKLPPEQRQQMAAAVAKDAGASLSRLDPRLYGDNKDEKRSALMQLWIEMGNDKNDHEGFKKFVGEQQADKSGEGRESFTNDPKQFVKIGGRWMRPGNRGGFAPVPQGFEPPEDTGPESTAPESLMWRQVVNAFGGLYDPNTGEFTITDPKARARAQNTMARASRIYRDGGGQITPSEAVERALNRKEPPARESAGLPPEVAAKLKPGVITTFANGQKWTLRDGKPVQVQ